MFLYFRMKVLKHSALLNVREKFENIIALNLFILVHVKSQPQVPSGDPEKDKIISELVKFMNASLQWAKAMPHWITQSSNYQAPTTETGLSFIDGLRDLFEHENEYIPEKVRVYKYHNRNFQLGIIIIYILITG